MTTTPTLWLAEQQANTTDAGTPGTSQANPRVVGLADGTFVVLWESNTDGGPDAGSAGTDIIGQRYDAEGNKIGIEFRANNGFFADDEGDFTATALPNGTFVVAFEDTDAAGTAIRYSILGADGTPITNGTIASDPGTEILGAPSITANSDGSFLVSYQQTDSTLDQTATFATIVDSSGTAGTPFLLLSGNLSEFTSAPQVTTTTLVNGNYVIVAKQLDGDFGFNMRIVTPTGTNVLGFTEVAGTLGDAESDTDPSVAALSGGGFVVVWTNSDGTDTDTLFQIYSATGTPVGTVRGVNGGGLTDNTNEAEVVGLSDGGFVVVYDDDETDSIRLQRYDSAGTEVGTEVTVTTAAFESDPTISLTDDGRLLVAWTSSSGGDLDPAFAIFDPRESSINGTGGTDTITSRIEGSTVNGLGGADTLLGQEGADRLIGDSGADSILGGAGGDLIEGGFDDDRINGQIGDDIIYAMTQADERGSSVGDVLVGAAGNDSLFGSNGNDVVQGNGDDDFLRGNGGIDTLEGGGGNDTIAWGTNQIVAGEVASGGAGTGDRILIEGNVLLNLLGTGLTGFEEIEFDAGIATVKNVTLRADQIGLGQGLSPTAIIDGAQIGFADQLRVNMLSDTNVNLSGFVFVDWDSSPAEGDRVTVVGDVDTETIVGSDVRDLIQGNGGSDTLTGGLGIDRLEGGNGDDTYTVDAAGEAVENPGQGIDLVRSTVSYALGANLENLRLLGPAVINATGNDLGNIISGNGANNFINGLLGSDVLTGGGGADRFVFSTALSATNVDQVTDFAAGVDIIRLDDAIFTALNPGALPGGAFHIGNQAADAGDRIIYNATNGNLFYDADGLGGAAQVRFARLDPGLALAAGDFFVF